MPADDKMKTFRHPGNALGDRHFHEEDPSPNPTEAENGNLGFDDFQGGDPKPLEHGGLPFKNLKDK